MKNNCTTSTRHSIASANILEYHLSVHEYSKPIHNKPSTDNEEGAAGTGHNENLGDGSILFIELRSWHSHDINQNLSDYTSENSH